MTTTDRMPNLDSRREITDRLGQTVILGNSVSAGTISIIAAAVAGASGASEARVPLTVTAISTIEWFNASFGIWAVYLDIDATASWGAVGAMNKAARFDQDAAASFSAITNAGGLINVQVFTATAAYTPSAGVTKIFVECVGGGGGGGGCAATGGAPSLSGGGGGGAGAMALGFITSGFSGVTVTIGAGGAGGAAGDNNGSNGGATTFGSVLSAGGGGGGEGDAAGSFARAVSPGAGGAASGSASLGGFGGASGQLGYALTGNAVFGGNGGHSPYGSGGPFNISGGGSAPGSGASGKGAGGAGAVGMTSSAAQAGGAGSAGICFIYEFNS